MSAFGRSILRSSRNFSPMYDIPVDRYNQIQHTVLVPRRDPSNANAIDSFFAGADQLNPSNPYT